MFRKILILGLFVLPVFGGAFFLYRYGVNVLFMDEFAMTPLAISDHLPSLADLFHQHNEHRIFFPKLVYFFLAKASAMNSLAPMWASFTLVTVLYGAVLLQLTRRASGLVIQKNLNLRRQYYLQTADWHKDDKLTVLHFATGVYGTLPFRCATGVTTLLPIWPRAHLIGRRLSVLSHLLIFPSF